MILEPGDKLKHLITGEEGTFIKTMPWTVGSNHGEGLLVDVNGHERFWISEETAFLERPIPKQGP